MNDELEKLLYTKYPKLFKNVTNPNRPMDFFWGCEHEAGWFGIVDSLCKEIVRHINWKHRDTPEDERPYPLIEQVKEKFGSLRFYVDREDSEISAMISLAEEMSSRTCEVCGCPGTTRPGSWIKTLCDKHAEERGYNGKIEKSE